MKRAIVYLVIWLVLIALVIRGAFVFLDLQKPSFFLEIFLFTFGISILGFSILKTMRERMKENYVNAIIGSIAVRLFLSITFIAIVISMDRLVANANAIFFLILYFSYTFVEVRFLLKKS